jgi:hypothetical protein
MKRLFRLFVLFAFGLAMVKPGVAQEVKISGELRPRYEMRHGYGTLIPDDVDAANFVSQRTRLNAFYGNSNYRFNLSLQDVRVWGDVPQLNKSDIYGPSVHEAWAELLLNENWALKAGRQEIIYDDSRIFGNVGWVQQARSHDAVIIKFTPNANHRVDVGLAYNAALESNFKTDYTISNYKTMQYAWYHGNFEKVGLSFLALNSGYAYDTFVDSAIVEKIAYSLTIGPRISYKNDALSANAAFYYQTGKNAKYRPLNAMYAAADVSYQIQPALSVGLGVEYLSGTASKDVSASNDDHSFTPLYGTNHKFNGWMDYFYVGNHSGSVGLVDIYVPVNYKMDKWLFTLMPHLFNTAATLSTYSYIESKWEDYNSYLGTEIDISAAYAFSPEVTIEAGYSQLFASESMQVLRGGDYKSMQNWAWVMLTVKPVFFSSSK